jgi:hypothetical protein
VALTLKSEKKRIDRNLVKDEPEKNDELDVDEDDADFAKLDDYVEDWKEYSWTESVSFAFFLQSYAMVFGVWISLP